MISAMACRFYGIVAGCQRIAGLYHRRRAHRFVDGQTRRNFVRPLQANSLKVLSDDRNESSSSKFADADLFGIPTQIVIGKVTRESGEVEIRQRGARRVLV